MMPVLLLRPQPRHTDCRRGCPCCAYQAQRRLLFSTATGLVEHDGWRAALPARRDRSIDYPPSDHRRLWRIPGTRGGNGCVVTSEPYTGSYERSAVEWCAMHGWQFHRTKFAGMYNTDPGACSLYLMARRDLDMTHIMRALDACAEL